MQAKTSKVVILLGCGVALAGLALMAYIGFYNRYWSDDWCYNRDFTTLGALGALKGYFEFPGGYSSNRYSLTLFSGLLHLAGIPGTQVLATLVISLWLGGLYWNLYNLSRLSVPVPKSLLLLASSLLLYFVLYLSPQRFQILYWRAGVMPYSAAILSGLYIFAILTGQMLRERPSKAANFLIAPLAFLAGGFSEIGCVLLFSGVTLLCAWTWWKRRQGQAWAVRAFPAAVTAVIFLGLAMLALVLSPANDRVQDLKIEPADPWMVPLLSLQYAAYFIFDSLKTMPLPHLVFVLCLAALPFLAGRPGEGRLSHPGRLFIVLTLLTFLLVAAIQAPTAYFYNAPPDPRGQSLSRFVMLAGLALLAGLGGWLAACRWPGRWAYAAALILVLAGTVYTARSLPVVYAELPGYIQRAREWDARDAYIRAARQQGIQYVEVDVIDTSAIQTRDIMRSRQTDDDRWMNLCAAVYYDLKGLKYKSP